MILWINGAFGVGKSQTAHELHRRIPRSFVYDPERIGYFINKNTPNETHKGDFQDYDLWRDSNYNILKYIHDEYDGTVIAPMTIVDPVYFEEIVGRLRRDGIVIHHYVLWASEDTLKKRLRSRGERKNSWAAEQIDRCMVGLSDDVFHERILTDDKTIGEVVEAIAAKSEIELLPDNRNRLRKRVDRMKTQWKQTRFFN
ncbi:AAA family ATPase [Thalassobacillus hwangdonensis]|uniref:AAA family ATPase n=1 Tax=Thalassobacillus hwangdonensis TaxID=546108 RepID=A0ABW3L2V1_9BACI